MSDLSERLRALADSLAGDDWDHPLLSQEACREAAAILDLLPKTADGAPALDTMKDLFTWNVDESRKLVLRDDQHWYCLDAGEPEKLWSVASVTEMTMVAEIERLQGILDKLLYDAQHNGFIGDNLPDAVAWATRQMGESCRLRSENDRMRPELIRLRVENVRLLTCGCGVKYAVGQRSDCRPDERDMISTPPRPGDSS